MSPLVPNKKEHDRIDVLSFIRFDSVTEYSLIFLFYHGIWIIQIIDKYCNSCAKNSNSLNQYCAYNLEHK